MAQGTIRLHGLPGTRKRQTCSTKAYDRGDQRELATGTLETIDNQIDVTTGTVKLRAMFQNADERLFPNQFVNARLTIETIKDAPIIPTAAILRGAPGTYVYLMQGDDKVAVRPIKTGESDSTRTVVTSGLQAGDRIVVDGTDRLRDGAQVRITGTGEAQAAASTTAPGSTAAASTASGDGAKPNDAAAAPNQPRRRRGGQPAP